MAPDDLLLRLRSAFEPNRNAGRAAAMARYMRDQFPFLGSPTVERRALMREALRGAPRPCEQDLRDVATALYALPEREYHYVAVDYVIANVRACTPSFLPFARWLVETHSWWDTVDGIAARIVGPLVLRFPELVPEMDRWVADASLWVRRTAILHQLTYKEHTDPERLFRYCLLQAADTDFFIRKAIGWALREYSRTDPEAVRAFISANDARLSGLTKREGMLRITGRKPKAAKPA